MSTRTVNAGRGRYLGSMVARLDERDQPVEWWRAPSRWAADMFADYMSVERPTEKFAVYDGCVA